MQTETHTGGGIQNVMIQGDLHYSLRGLANVCLCARVCGGGGGGGGDEECEATRSRKTTSIWWNSSTEPHFP